MSRRKITTALRISRAIKEKEDDDPEVVDR